MPKLHIMEIIFVSIPADACDKINFPIDDSNNPAIPWADVIGQIVAEEAMYDDNLQNDIPYCNDQTPAFEYIEVTHGGCYDVDIIINELEVRRILYPCDPGRVEKCYQNWKLCKVWDPVNGWIVHAESNGAPLPQFDCSGVYSVDGDQCESICE